MEATELEGADMYTRIKWLNEHGYAVVFFPTDISDPQVKVAKHGVEVFMSAKKDTIEAFNEAEAQAMKRIKEVKADGNSTNTRDQ